MKIQIILIVITVLALLLLSACTDNGNLKEWNNLFFGTSTPEITSTPALPPGDVNWEVTPEPNEGYLPIINNGGEP